ncbi:hypothetical protein HPP92_006161 [Vanilla planifolia]|uniref:Uncharacterized protein n=1 Tax=Vanilla planifolia TaxID=51239 RepID=A0A835RLK7_VANPL|nr:hypothetical protein HPP92_006161 [Vanilla planifolia]
MSPSAAILEATGRSKLKFLTGTERTVKSDGSDCFDKDGERFWVRSSTHGSLEGSGFLGPTGLRPLRWNSGDLPGDLHSMAIPDENIMDAKNFGSSGVLLGIPEFDPSSAERKMDVNMFKEENRTVGADSKCRVLVQENGDSVELNA